MRPLDVIKNLKQFGLKLDTAERSQACIDAFCVQMESRQYGVRETADAFLWFETGWKAAAARLQ